MTYVSRASVDGTAGGRLVLRNTILIGDARKVLARLPAASVDTIITSPPYFGVRNYGHDRQLGTSEDVDGWVTEVREIIRGSVRVLRPTGSLWLNLGDSYAYRRAEGARPKSLLFGPQRLALALLADGWRIRNEVVWAKANPMPSSATNRLTTTHEVIYLCVRSAKYYFDLDAIRQPLVTTKHQSTSDPSRGYPPDAARAASRPGRPADDNVGLARLRASGAAGHPLGKNPGDVWRLATAGFRGGHFAAFPVSLVERALLATCPERVCGRCGTPWRHAQERRRGRLLAVGSLTPSCACGDEGVRGLVLDPFMGTGTTAVAAEKHGRDWLGIELNPEYVAMATERMQVFRKRRGDGRSVTR